MFCLKTSSHMTSSNEEKIQLVTWLLHVMWSIHVILLIFSTGSAKIHSGTLTGLTNIERLGDFAVKKTGDGLVKFAGSLVVKDVKADFKLDAKIFNRIPINGKDINAWFTRALILAELEFDPRLNSLTIGQLMVKGIEGFGIKSNDLRWPLNRFVDSILNKQRKRFERIIEEQTAKYMGLTLDNFNLFDLFEKVNFRGFLK